MNPLTKTLATVVTATVLTMSAFAQSAGDRLSHLSRTNPQTLTIASTPNRR